jgi:hypothetical protein
MGQGCFVGPWCRLGTVLLIVVISTDVWFSLLNFQTLFGASLQDMQKHHAEFLVKVIELCAVPKKTTLAQAIVQLDLQYGGKLLGANKEANSRDEAYALKVMVVDIKESARHTTDGSRLPSHVKSIIERCKSQVKRQNLLCVPQLLFHICV